MSMLSAQVDRLRELATGCDELQVGVVKAVTMPSDMGSILRDAADTIWQLRDDLQRTNAENAKLRNDAELLREMLQAKRQETHALMSENAKLRELISIMAYCIQGWRECDGCRVNGGAGIITERAGCYVLLDRLRELGMEVE